MRKALSCVYRTGQRFGVGYVIDVLRGSENERILQSGHHLVTTFGIGKELSATQWKSVFRQLVANGYLRADPDGYGALQLTESCRALLRGEATLQLRLDPDKKTSSTRTRTARADLPPVSDPVGWEALRARRKALAEEQGVAPFMIFHDATLQEILEKRPATLSEMASVNGVGAAKLERYGQVFLDVLATLD